MVPLWGPLALAVPLGLAITFVSSPFRGGKL